MIKQIDVHKDSSHGTAKLHPSLPTFMNWDCEMLSALLVTGILTTPIQASAFSLAQFWPWMRYLPALDHAANLRLRPEWTDLDSHQKTLLSDDFGLGLTSYFLIDKYDFTHFGDTTRVLKTVLKDFAALAKDPKKKGPAKSPDFIALDANDHFHILECKGSQDSQSKLSEAIANGIQQKNNISNCSPNLFLSSMVGGIFVPQFSSSESARIVFADPTPDELRQLENVDPKELAAAVRRDFFSRCLTFAGLQTTGRTISGNNVSGREISELRNQTEFEDSGFLESQTGFEKVATRVFDTDGSDRQRTKLTFSIRIENEVREALAEAAGSGQIIDVKAVDSFLLKRHGKWAERGTPKGDGMVITLPFGIEFELKQEPS
ncbi:hypothetical protein [Xanthomonas vesicatoria]|uniref:hypothetical protein n=1 Tax=Xanthomonas vesicatoria TaxID=56460 RepID=UPI001E2D402E|nr:hypothetical protein [Xanthomonas vesicatoria]MCC8620116.1 hypothetical protein [Xanthomonas vesicatoria]MCC8633251.1 hypothetical protein [Xanthomonas vesicatoria]